MSDDDRRIAKALGWRRTRVGCHGGRSIYWWEYSAEGKTRPECPTLTNDPALQMQALAWLMIRDWRPATNGATWWFYRPRTTERDEYNTIGGALRAAMLKELGDE